MKKIAYIVFLLIAVTSYSQESFPKSWQGNYEGELQIYAVDSIRMKLKMKLQIQLTASDSLYNWTMIYYLKGKKDVRGYELKIVDTKTGHYQIDEKNSIIIDGYYKNGVFTSFFKVMDNLIIATYTMNDKGEIIFEIISSNAKEVSTTGGKKVEDEDIPEVFSYKVTGRQKAVLYKIE